MHPHLSFLKTCNTTAKSPFALQPTTALEYLLLSFPNIQSSCCFLPVFPPISPFLDHNSLFQVRWSLSSKGKGFGEMMGFVRRNRGLSFVETIVKILKNFCIIYVTSYFHHISQTSLFLHFISFSRKKLFLPLPLPFLNAHLLNFLLQRILFI